MFSNRILPNSTNKMLNGKSEMKFQKCECSEFIPIKIPLCECGEEMKRHDPSLVLSVIIDREAFLPKKNLPKVKWDLVPCNDLVLKDTLKCACGLVYEQHDRDTQKNYSLLGGWIKDPIEWSSLYHTKDCDCTNAQGIIKFDRNERYSKYVRISHKTDTDKIMKLLFTSNQWDLAQPKLLISISGGSHLNLKPSFEKKFCQGLNNAACSTNAWIISGGSNMGYMKLVGETFKKNAMSLGSERPVVLGIVNWTTIRRRDFLVSNKEKTYYLTNKQSNSEISANLDPFHTHFIMVDNAHLNKFGGEISYRAQLESAISQRSSMICEYKNHISNSANTPLVLLVIGGGRKTLDQVCESIKKEIPCVFFDESGKFSNVFAFILKKIKVAKIFKKNGKQFTNSFVSELKAKIKIEMKKENIVTKFKSDEKELEKTIKSIEEICQEDNQKYLSYFRFDHNMSIDIAILKSLKKIMCADREFLDLCLTWNQLDIAKDVVLKDENKEKLGSLDNFMYNAIQNDKPEFVEHFLDSGFVLKNWLTNRILLKLYNSLPNDSHLKTILCENGEDTFTFKEIGHVIEKLSNLRHIFTEKKYSNIKRKVIITILNETDEFGIARLRSNRFVTDFETELDLQAICNNPALELFIYSVLLERYEMAILFWTNLDHGVSFALFASKIFRSYAEKFQKKQLISKDLSERFEDLACKTLDISCKNDKINEENSFQMLTQKSVYLQKTSLEVATTNSINLKFLNHPTCQKLFQKVWMEPVVNYSSVTFKFYLSIACPLLAPLLLKLNNQNVNNDEHNLTVISTTLHLKDSESDVSPLSHKLKKNLYNSFNKVCDYFENVVHFCQCPCVKYAYHNLFHLLFLILLSYVVLCDFKQIDKIDIISPQEIVLIIWVLSYGLEEIRRFSVIKTSKIKAKWHYYIKQNWNLIGIFAIVFFILVMILRFIPNSDCFRAARFIMAIDVILWYMKTFSTFWLFERLGSMLVIIENMILQLIYFLFFIVLIIFAFGVAMHSLLYPNSELDSNLMKGIFFPSFFVLGKEYYLRNELMNPSKTCQANNPQNNCTHEFDTDATLVIYVILIVIMNLFFLNMLIAFFNNQYRATSDNVQMIWTYQRYTIVHEYISKPILPAPFIIFPLFYRALKAFLTSCCIYNNLHTKLDASIINWENYAVNQLVFAKQKTDQADSIKDDKDMNNYIKEDVMQKFINLEDKVNQVIEKFDKLTTPIVNSPVLDSPNLESPILKMKKNKISNSIRKASLRLVEFELLDSRTLRDETADSYEMISGVLGVYTRKKHGIEILLKEIDTNVYELPTILINDDFDPNEIALKLICAHLEVDQESYNLLKRATKQFNLIQKYITMENNSWVEYNVVHCNDEILSSLEKRDCNKWLNLDEVIQQKLFSDINLVNCLQVICKSFVRN